ncbi:hypothetical protein DXG03_003349 [Asterophora parasitica]|uniref:TauD/TfdA-like domain-containing protein n=1 Tax=Asterophora parasitica TaxID=117018 RepID=A0A9P7G3B5_9AGAR|nr:hypothetical protein DXG03_003347 [Asterophora parasitica]KAG5642248.1 hypothetical protein DXG03_003349 [Asterophora parasitica]
MAAVAVQQVTDLLKNDSSLSQRTAELTVEAKAPTQPDIEYHPDAAKYKARTARRLAEDPSLPSTPLPEGFPKKLESPLVWQGSDFKDEKEWVYVLAPAHLKEIDDALKHFRGLEKPLGHISAATFPLPTLGPVLTDLAHVLHSGRGFFVLRAIPVDSYTREENAIIYAGVSSYVGNLRAVQDAPAAVAHIKDLTQTAPAQTIGAPGYTTDKQVFHTDTGDIIALFTLETAAEGGTSRISSTWKAYNELAETRPDLIKTLSEPWPLDGFGGTPAYTLRPLLFYLDEKVIIQYARRLFTGYRALPRSSDIPPITEAQAEALDALHFLGEKYNLGLNFQKGDIQYINNLSVFHARDAFVDTPEKTRHLLRLWLRNEKLAWKTPTELEPNWKRLYYTTPSDEHTFPLEPTVRSAVRGKGVKY